MAKKLTTEEFIVKSKLIHGEKYNYSLVVYKNSRTKIKILCPIHGLFEQKSSSHIEGCACPSCSGVKRIDLNEFIVKSKLIYGNTYDYSLIEKIFIKDKVKIICQIHGIFTNRVDSHLDGYGCKKCKKENKFLDLTKSFSEKSILKHGYKYDYSLVKYKGEGIKVTIVCPIHGEFKQKPYNHINGCGCPYCKESKGEKEIRIYLTNNNIEFIQWHRFKDCKNILPLSFDFYLPKFNLCIEFNGEQHYKSIKCFGGNKRFKSQKKRDKIKLNYCLLSSINLLIIPYNKNIIIELNNCLEKINNTLFC